MKNWLVFCFLLISCTVVGQHLKKKLYGIYTGTIPAYTLDIGADVIDVNATTITIDLSEERVTQQLGNTLQQGTWEIVTSDKLVIVLSVRLEGQLTEELLTLYKKTKTIRREGIFPQPTTELTKKN